MRQAIVKVLEMNAEQKTSAVTKFYRLHNWSVAKIILYVLGSPFQTLICCFNIIGFHCIMQRSPSISISLKCEISILEQTGEGKKLIAKHIEDRDTFLVSSL